MAPALLLTGTEPVLVAQVPKAGGRWHQVHFNMDVGRRFFRVEEGEDKTVLIERISAAGDILGSDTRRLVLGINRNYRLEFDFSPDEVYPDDSRPLLVIVEVGLRRFRYVTLMPGQPGHEEMLRITEVLESIGGGLPRVITMLDEIELRWPACPLRGAIAEEQSGGDGE
jgi:hypothetical protein